jgi:hypothetical protein
MSARQRRKGASATTLTAASLTVAAPRLAGHPSLPPAIEQTYSVCEHPTREPRCVRRSRHPYQSSAPTVLVCQRFTLPSSESAPCSTFRDLPVKFRPRNPFLGLTCTPNSHSWVYKTLFAAEPPVTPSLRCRGLTDSRLTAGGPEKPGFRAPLPPQRRCRRRRGRRLPPPPPPASPGASRGAAAASGPAAWTPEHPGCRLPGHACTAVRIRFGADRRCEGRCEGASTPERGKASQRRSAQQHRPNHIGRGRCTGPPAGPRRMCMAHLRGATYPPNPFRTAEVELARWACCGVTSPRHRPRTRQGEPAKTETKGWCRWWWWWWWWCTPGATQRSPTRPPSPRPRPGWSPKHPTTCPQPPAPRVRPPAAAHGTGLTGARTASLTGRSAPPPQGPRR